MDARGFDDLTRRVARAASRRSLLRGADRRRCCHRYDQGWHIAGSARQSLDCHWDEEEQGYALLSVSQRGWENGHQGQHEQDELPG